MDDTPTKVVIFDPQRKKKPPPTKLPAPRPRAHRVDVEVKQIGCDADFGTCQVTITCSWSKEPLRYSAVGERAVAFLVQSMRKTAEANRWGFKVSNPQQIAERVISPL